MLPNWAETVTFKVEVPPKAKANHYSGQIAVTARSQLAIRAKAGLELEVLTPLELNAYLRPHRATGFKANYRLILRNRTVCNSFVTLGLDNSNPFCAAHFSSNRVNVMAGQAQVVRFQLRLQPKAPPDQAEQSQAFAVAIQPEWQVGGSSVLTPGTPLSVAGEYIPQPRLAFTWAKKHPRLFILLAILLAIALLWSFVIVPLVREGLLTGTAQKVVFQGPATNPLRFEQNSFNQTLQAAYNPLGPLAQMQLSFTEPHQTVAIKLTSWFFSTTLMGHLSVSPTSGDLVFQADDPKQLNTFPWFFLPPDQLAQRLSPKLKTWLARQSQRLDKAEIEGNTLFLRLKACVPGEPACVHN